MKEKLQFIVISFFMWLLFSTINVLANSYQYDSSDVLYDNSNTDIESTDVQGAVSELYRTATDYSSLDGRVTNLEGYLHNYGNENWIQVGQDSSFTGNTGFKIINNNARRSLFYYNVSDDVTYLGAGDSSGRVGSGKLDLRGNPVKINGVSVGIKQYYQYKQNISNPSTSQDVNTINFTTTGPSIILVRGKMNYIYSRPERHEIFVNSSRVAGGMSTNTSDWLNATDINGFVYSGSGVNISVVQRTKWQTDNTDCYAELVVDVIQLPSN